MEQVNKLYLDYKIWRCGGDNLPHEGAVLGKGYTRLLNEEGYACCLGQFSVQLNKEIKKDDLLNVPGPIQLLNSVGKKADLLVETIANTPMNTELSIKAMDINDNPFTPVKDKILQLQRLFATKNIQVEVLNMP